VNTSGGQDRDSPVLGHHHVYRRQCTDAPSGSGVTSAAAAAVATAATVAVAVTGDYDAGGRERGLGFALEGGMHLDATIGSREVHKTQASFLENMDDARDMVLTGNREAY